MTNPHFIVFANEKGGTGKSTTAVHTAVALAASGHRVAALDLDRRPPTLPRYLRTPDATTRRRPPRGRPACPGPPARRARPRQPPAYHAPLPRDPRRHHPAARQAVAAGALR